jgi:DNA-binding NtrC family response regulator
VSSAYNHRPKLLWTPSDSPDLFERKLWDELQEFAPIVCRTESQTANAAREASGSVILALAPAAHWNVESLFSQVKTIAPESPFFLRDMDLSVSKAVQLIKRGITGIFGRGDAVESVVNELRKALVPTGSKADDWRQDLIGNSAAMLRLCSTVELVARRRGTVLISGESGSGKEVVARSIHRASARASHRFVAVNCSAIPGPLLEAELFGHVRGAFTGAHAHRIGWFEQAQGGTIFLDEIGDLDPELQTKLLRVLQERELQRLGSSETVRLDVRVIAATNVDLMARIREGSFRPDLYYRLNVIPIEMPPLRHRKSDIPILSEHFLRKICSAEGIPERRLTDAAKMCLAEQDWPGNVRQLENIIERAVALSGDRLVLDHEDFDFPDNHFADQPDEEPALPEHGLDYERVVSRFEWNLLSQALRKSGGNKKLAADLLGLKRTTLAAKVKVLAVCAGETVM